MLGSEAHRFMQQPPNTTMRRPSRLLDFVVSPLDTPVIETFGGDRIALQTRFDFPTIVLRSFHVAPAPILTTAAST